MPLPNPEPIGLPAPVWLLQALLVLTFSLHVIPMLVTVGGTLAAAVLEIYGRAAARADRLELASRLWHILPTVTAFTVTLGVAPLLFLQLVYGKFFYPASILTGWSWFLVVPLLIVGYGLLYAQAMGGADRAWRPWAGVASALAFTGVAAIYVSTMSLTTAPELWKGMYAQSQAGLHWHFQAARGLHVLLGAIAMAGALLGVAGHTAAERDVAGRLARRAAVVWLGAGVLLQIPVGYWFYTTLSEAARGAVAPALAGAAGALGLAALAAAAAGRSRARPLLGWAGLAGVALAGVVLAVQRHMVRQALLQPHITAADWKLQPQWDVFGLFALALVGALSLVGYLVLRFSRASRAAERRLDRAS